MGCPFPPGSGNAAVCQTSGPGVKPWPPTSRGIVCAWGFCPAFWCCRSAAQPWWRSDGAEAGSLAACLLAEDPLGVGSPQNPAEPRVENPGASGRPRYSLCAWSLKQRRDENCYFSRLVKWKMKDFLLICTMTKIYRCLQVLFLLQLVFAKMQF